VLFGKDVTPRVRAEAALRVAKDQAESANKAKSHFLASMSHELRTPLNSVIGFTNILLKNKDGHLTEKDVGFLQRVLANGKHLLDLINEVLDLAKIEAGRMELVFEEVDLGDLVTETVQQLEGQVKVKEGNVQLVAEVPSEVAPIGTDPAKLKQVIINLVGNALKFTEEGSVTVRLDLASDGRTPVAIVVRDTGIGIAEDRLEGIFEAFQQAEAGTARKYGGTGLGLAISRSMCLLMGYDLIVESTLGVGSTFSIVMGERAKKPARPPEADETDVALALAGADSPTAGGPGDNGEASTPTPLSDLAGFTVLVIDDENDSRVLMRHYLEEFGCRVLTAAGGDEGISSARSNRPDLITLDLMMPGMTGSEVLERLKGDPELAPIPVVVVSIVAGEGGNGLGGAADLLSKPFEREDLLRVLRRSLLGTDRGSALVLADAPDERELLTGLLEHLAFEVTTTEGVGAGLAAVETQGPDVVLLDLASGSHGVFGFLEKLREGPSYGSLPVLVVLDEEPRGRDRTRLVEMASGVLVRGDAMGMQLTEALDALFPRPARTERPT
jgi:CheY-like chemotaxis protein/nitrogen-specific signal transduction histidine kinase